MITKITEKCELCKAEKSRVSEYGNDLANTFALREIEFDARRQDGSGTYRCRIHICTECVDMLIRTNPILQFFAVSQEDE